jgi:hypothetical protein
MMILLLLKCVSSTGQLHAYTVKKLWEFSFCCILGNIEGIGRKVPLITVNAGMFIFIF